MKSFIAAKYRQLPKVLYIWLGLLFVSALLILGHFHPDELGQITAFALAKVGVEPPELLPWEYPAKMRSWLVPDMYIPIIAAGKALLGHYNYFFTDKLMLLFNVLLWFFLLPILNKTLHISKAIDGGNKQQLVLMALCGFSWCLPSMVVRHSSEAVGLMVLLLYLYLQLPERKERLWPGEALLVGLIAAVAFWCRFQNAFFVAGFWCSQAVYELKKERRLSLSSWLIALGVILGLIIGIGIDSAGYGTFTVSFYNYFRENILNDVASFFGRKSVFYYLYQLIAVTANPFFLVWVLYAAYALWKERYYRNISVGLALFFLAHLLVPHKEIRFMLPMTIPALMLLFAHFEQHPWEKMASKWRFIYAERFGKIFLGLNIAILVLYSAFGLSNNHYRLMRDVFAIPHAEGQTVRLFSNSDIYGYFHEEYDQYPKEKIPFTRWGFPFLIPEFVSFTYADSASFAKACTADKEAYLLLSKENSSQVLIGEPPRPLVDYPYKESIAAFPPRFTFAGDYFWLKMKWWKRMRRYQIINCADFLNYLEMKN